MSYSPSYTDLFRRATFYTSRNGALAHECDGYGVGPNAVASGAGWQALRNASAEKEGGR